MNQWTEEAYRHRVRLRRIRRLVLSAMAILAIGLIAFGVSRLQPAGYRGPQDPFPFFTVHVREFSGGRSFSLMEDAAGNCYVIVDSSVAVAPSSACDKARRGER
jgi:hypothetical protein